MPNRSRTSVPLANLASNSNTKPHPAKSKALQEARAMGRRHAASWSELDPTMHPRDAWRAIGYADAVLSFEHSPLLAELIQAWEQGFDGKDAPPNKAEAEKNTNPDAVDGPGNPYYRNPDRAPYELGHLLQQLPSDFGLTPAAAPEHMQIASAIERHADAAGSTILCGIEAIGRLMEIAGTHEEEVISAHTLFCLGDLLRHLAVEGQYVRGIGDSMAYATALRAQRGTASEAKEARHA